MKDSYSIFKEAVEVVREVGKIVLAPDALEIEKKGPTDFVTQMDYAVQTALMDRLLVIAPEYMLMGEEKDNSGLDVNGKLWILDPVDGTTNLIHRFKHSGISLAMAENGEVIGGIVYLPFFDDMYTAFKGKGAYCNGEPIHVSKAETLSASLFSTGTNPGHREKADTTFAMMREFYDACHDIRRLGAACIELCYVASGRLEGYVEYGLKAWDYAAGGLILTEAGGCLTDYNGKIPVCGAHCAVVATNGLVHEEVLEIVKKYNNC